MTGGPELIAVETLYEQNLRDVPGQLRRIAENIEAGLISGRSAVLVVETEPSCVDVWAWGDTDNWRASGMMMQAATMTGQGLAPAHEEMPGGEPA